MYCTKCGAENADTNKFCSRCGSPLTPGGTVAPAHTPEKKGNLRRMIGAIAFAIGIIGVAIGLYVFYSADNPVESFGERGTTCNGSCRTYFYELHGPVADFPYDCDFADFHVSGPCYFAGAAAGAPRFERHDELSDVNISVWKGEVRSHYRAKAMANAALYGGVGIVLLIFGLLLRRKSK